MFYCNISYIKGLTERFVLNAISVKNGSSIRCGVLKFLHCYCKRRFDIDINIDIDIDVGNCL